MSYESNTPNILFYTNTCQLACEYCYEQQRMNLSEPFTAKFEDFKDNIDDLAKNISNQTITIVVFGGEPTLAMDSVYDTIKYTNQKYPNKFIYYMNTNGIAFDDDEFFNKFKDFYFNGNNNIAVTLSYDGSSNFRRKFKDGTDSTDIILRVIDKFNDINIPFNISYCLNYFNYDVAIKDFIQIITKWENMDRLVISVNYKELDKKLDCYDIEKLDKLIKEHLEDKCNYLFKKFKKPICDFACGLCDLCIRSNNRNYISPNKESVQTVVGNNPEFNMF